MGVTVALSAGSHTFAVQAKGNNTGSNATVSGDNASVLQGALNVVIVKQ